MYLKNKEKIIKSRNAPIIYNQKVSLAGHSMVQTLIMKFGRDL
uniref:Uncharacterized protein n=1 Tax=Rhizophora mucronata TaxID=61149 RepID=A0A2P2JCB5_RHIMU